jgi:hypothetical protein
MGNSPFARIISAQASKTIIDLALSELIADKLPFTPSRLKPSPFAARILSGAVCGATIYGVVKRPLTEGGSPRRLGSDCGSLFRLSYARSDGGQHLAHFRVRQQPGRNRVHFGLRQSRSLHDDFFRPADSLPLALPRHHVRSSSVLGIPASVDPPPAKVRQTPHSSYFISPQCFVTAFSALLVLSDLRSFMRALCS